MRRAFIPLLLAVIVGGCYGPDPDTSAAGRGLPELAVEFPDSSDAGSTQTAVLTITNPGPQDMSQIVVAFLRVGPGGDSPELPNPIVDGAARHENPAVVAIDPEPNAVSLPAVEFTFDGIPAGESMDISFRLKIPELTGPAANSVTVYEGSDPERARGIRLETVVD